MTAVGVGVSPMFHRGNVAWAPTRLAGLRLWLRADRGLTLDGGRVSSWANLAGDLVPAAQANAANRPLATGAGATAAVLFDRTRPDFLTRISLPNPATYSLVIVHSLTALPVAQQCVCANGRSASWSVAAYHTASGRALEHATVAGRYANDLTTNLERWENRWTGAQMGISKNGAAWSEGACGGIAPHADSGFALGAAHSGGGAPYSGSIREVVYYDPGLSDADWVLLRAYLLKRYGV